MSCRFMYSLYGHWDIRLWTKYIYIIYCASFKNEVIELLSTLSYMCRFSNNYNSKHQLIFFCHVCLKAIFSLPLLSSNTITTRSYLPKRTGALTCSLGCCINYEVGIKAQKAAPIALSQGWAFSNCAITELNYGILCLIIKVELLPKISYRHLCVYMFFELFSTEY